MTINLRLSLLLLGGIIVFFNTMTAATATQKTEAEETFALMLEAGNLSEAQKIYSATADISMAQRLVTAYIDAGNLSSADEVFQTMLLMDAKKDIIISRGQCAEKLAIAYSEEGSYASLIKVQRIFSKIEASSNIYYISEQNIGKTLVQLYAKHYSLEDLQTLYDELVFDEKSAGSFLLLALAEHLVSTYMDKNDFSSADAVYASLYDDGNHNPSFSVPVTQAMITGYLNAGDVNKAYDFFKMGTDGADLDLALADLAQSRVSLDLAVALIASGNLDAAYTIYTNTATFKFSDSVLHICALMGQNLVIANLDKGNTEIAASVYASMAKLGESENVQP